jgi:uncharacterized repeat protein (TIGR02543 family)
MKRMSRMVLAALLTIVMLGQMLPASFMGTFAEGDGIFYGTMDAPDYRDVMFYDYDGTTPLINGIQFVESGHEAVPPENPSRDGYTFTGWSPASLVVNQNTNFVAQYKLNAKFEVQVNYVYAGGGAAASTYKKEYPTEVAFAAPVSVPIPAVAGHVPVSIATTAAPAAIAGRNSGITTRRVASAREAPSVRATSAAVVAWSRSAARHIKYTYG